MSLLIEIDRYLRTTAMPVTRFGRLTVNDPRLVGDLRRGRQVGPKIATRVRTFMKETQQ